MGLTAKEKARLAELLALDPGDDDDAQSGKDAGKDVAGANTGAPPFRGLNHDFAKARTQDIGQPGLLESMVGPTDAPVYAPGQQPPSAKVKLMAAGLSLLAPSPTSDWSEAPRSQALEVGIPALRRVAADNSRAGGEGRSFDENAGRAVRRIGASLATGLPDAARGVGDYFSSPGKGGRPANAGDYLQRAYDAPSSLVNSLVKPAQDFGTSAGDIAGTPATPGGPERGVVGGLGEALRRDPGAPVEDFALPAMIAEGVSGQVEGLGSKFAKWSVSDLEKSPGLSAGSDPSVAKAAGVTPPFVGGYDRQVQTYPEPGGGYDQLGGQVSKPSGPGYGDLGTTVSKPPAMSFADQLSLKPADEYGMRRPEYPTPRPADPYTGTPTRPVESAVSPSEAPATDPYAATQATPVPEKPVPDPISDGARANLSPEDLASLQQKRLRKGAPVESVVAPDALVEVAAKHGITAKVKSLTQQGWKPFEIATGLDISPRMVEAVLKSGEMAKAEVPAELPAASPAPKTGMFDNGELGRVDHDDANALVDKLEAEGSQEGKPGSYRRTADGRFEVTRPDGRKVVVASSRAAENMLANDRANAPQGPERPPDSGVTRDRSGTNWRGGVPMTPAEYVAWKRENPSLAAKLNGGEAGALNISDTLGIKPSALVMNDSESAGPKAQAPAKSGAKPEPGVSFEIHRKKAREMHRMLQYDDRDRS